MLVTMPKTPRPTTLSSVLFLTQSFFSRVIPGVAAPPLRGSPSSAPALAHANCVGTSRLAYQDPCRSIIPIRRAPTDCLLDRSCDELLLNGLHKVRAERVLRRLDCFARLPCTAANPFCRRALAYCGVPRKAEGLRSKALTEFALRKRRPHLCGIF